MPKQLTARQKDKLIEAAQNAIHFAVVGKGGFPTDMLRYDKCWPANEHNSGLIDVVNQTVALAGGEHRIELLGLKDPTVARWRSFGWRVVAVNGERVA